MQPTCRPEIRTPLVACKIRSSELLLRLSRVVCIVVIAATCTIPIASAAERTATISIPASALVFKGDGLQPPDVEGHFAVGVELPLAMVKAENCDTSYLIVGMGSMNKPQNALSPADQKVIAHEHGVYDHLVSASKQEQAVKLSFRNNPEYLKISAGVVHAPYCMLSLDEDEAP